MMLVFAIGAALAVQPAQPLSLVSASDFDLSQQSQQTELRDNAAPLIPVQPRNLDTRGFDAPEAEWLVVEGGPVFVVGAIGGRRSGMPKLAHVALDWTF